MVGPSNSIPESCGTTAFFFASEIRKYLLLMGYEGNREALNCLPRLNQTRK